MKTSQGGQGKLRQRETRRKSFALLRSALLVAMALTQAAEAEKVEQTSSEERIQERSAILMDASKLAHEALCHLRDEPVWVSAWAGERCKLEDATLKSIATGEMLRARIRTTDTWRPGQIGATVRVHCGEWQSPVSYRVGGRIRVMGHETGFGLNADLLMWDDGYYGRVGLSRARRALEERTREITAAMATALLEAEQKAHQDNACPNAANSGQVSHGEPNDHPRTETVRQVQLALLRVAAAADLRAPVTDRD